MAKTINVIAVIRGSSFRATYVVGDSWAATGSSTARMSRLVLPLLVRETPHEARSLALPCCFALLCMLPLINAVPPGRAEPRQAEPSQAETLNCSNVWGAHRQGCDVWARPVWSSGPLRSYALIASIAICKIELKSIASACSDIDARQCQRFA